MNTTLVDNIKSQNVEMRIKSVYDLRAVKDKSFKILDFLLKDRSYRVRSAVLEVLTEMCAKQATDKLIVALKDKHYQVRYIAAESLGIIKSKKAVPFLIESLNDKDEVVRLNSAESLGYIKDSRAIPALINSLNDPDDLVRAYAAESLGLIADKKAIPVLLSRFKNEKKSSVKLRIHEALYLLGDKSKLKSIISILNDTDYRVRCAAAHILSELTDTGNFNLIHTALLERYNKEETIAVKSSITGSMKEILKQQAPGG